MPESATLNESAKFVLLSELSLFESFVLLSELSERSMSSIATAREFSFAAAAPLSPLAPDVAVWSPPAPVFVVSASTSEEPKPRASVRAETISEFFAFIFFLP